MPVVSIILKEQIKGLGSEADVVKVRAGYARNFLVPQGKALEATKGNMRAIASLKARRAEREAKEIAAAQEVATQLKRTTIKLTLQTGAGGKAFGSITATDVTKALEDLGFKLEKHAVQLEKAIKSTGKFDVPVRLHHDVTGSVKVHVSAESGEEVAEEGAEG
jgi:large subunit ribosomal protein L9